MSTKLFISLFSLSVLLLNCSSSKENESNSEVSDDQSTQKNEEAPVEPIIAPTVCIWDNIAVRETPAPKGKWITSLSIGESLSYLGIDSVVDKKTYSNIILNDGKKGWAIRDFIVTDAKPAVILSDISLYSRPDLLTKTDKNFGMMDIIASIETQGDWMKVKGKLGKWMSEGWVKSDNVSFEAIDIAGAKFAKKALAIENEEERKLAIKEVIENTDLAGSKFIKELESHLTEILEVPIEEVEEQEMDSVSVQ